MKALIIGGTGPTGPYLVNGLVERGYAVTIMHGGFHEVAFSVPVEHLHGDPHFEKTLEETLGNRTFDLIIFTYGRLRIAVEVAKKRTARFIAVGSVSSGAKSNDPRWGPIGRHLNVTEDTNILENNINANKFSYLIASSEEAVLQAHRDGYYSATYLAYPKVYGPRALAPPEWCIVRRILDKRKYFVIADGGLNIFGAAYSENAAQAVLLTVDKPDISGGKKYFVLDQKTYTIRQRIEFIAKYMKHEWELVDMPFDLATPCHALWRHWPHHHFFDTHKIQDELGYRDVVPTDQAIERTVDWLLQNQPQPGSETEAQLGDPFDYNKEDELIQAWKESRGKFPAISYPKMPQAHPYRHPSSPNEPWKRPKDWVRR